MIETAGVQLDETVVTGRPAWAHEPSGVVFRRLPAGGFRMGLSPGELAALEELSEDENVDLDIYDEEITRAQPVRWVRVPSFLLARHPLTVAQARRLLPEYEQPTYADRDQCAVAVLEDAAEPARMLAASPLRLPSEAEWERGARGGTRTLIWWGNYAPRDGLVEDLIERCLDACLVHEQIFHHALRLTENASPAPTDPHACPTDGSAAPTVSSVHLAPDPDGGSSPYRKLPENA